LVVRENKLQKGRKISRILVRAGDLLMRTELLQPCPTLQRRGEYRWQLTLKEIFLLDSQYHNWLNPEPRDNMDQTDT